MGGEFIAPDPVLFEGITGQRVKRIGMHVSGSAGPSGLDAVAWQRLLSLYGKASDSLCEALAGTARRLCREEVPNDELQAYLAGRLIPLAKNTGARPIAVGEDFRRIIGKVIMATIEADVLQATAPSQLCVGIPSACEAAVEALTQLFGRSEVDGVMLIDASNAFNALNRSVAPQHPPCVSSDWDDFPEYL